MIPAIPAIPPIDPTGALGGEWQIQGVGGLDPAEAATDPSAVAGVSGGGFGGMLTQQIGKLDQLQTDAATASQAIADGTSTDTTGAVMAVEKAQMAMQLASQLRTKGVEALTDIFHTQV